MNAPNKSVADNPVPPVDQASATPVTKPKPKELRDKTVAALRIALDPKSADAGVIAALRRCDPESPPPAFYRVATGILDKYDDNLGTNRDDRDTRWTIVASAFARAQGFLDGFVPFGQALAQANVAEMRFLRLMEASTFQLPHVVRSVVHQLTQKGQPFDPRELADLVLTADTEEGRMVRRRIARSYYRHADK